MSIARRLVGRLLRDAQDLSPQRSRLKTFLVMIAAPAIGAAIGALGGVLVGLELMLAAGHGVAHSGAAAGVVLGLWGLCILVGAALGAGLTLLAATLVRGLRFALGRRPWPWGGSVHLGALVFAAGVVLGLDHLGRAPRAQAVTSSGTVVRLAADLLGLVLALPAAVAGGLTGSWLHGRASRR